MGVLVPRRWCQNDVQQVFTKLAKKTQSHVKTNDRLSLVFFCFFWAPLAVAVAVAVLVAVAVAVAMAVAVAVDRLARGRQKKIDGPPRPFAKSQTHPPAIRLFFITFLSVSRQGEFKNTTTIFLQKVHVGKKKKKIDKTFDVSCSSTFFVLSRFRVFFSEGVQKHHKKRFRKKSCRKVFTKNSTKNPKPTFSRIFCYHVFGRFSMRGVQKRDKKYRKNKSDPSPFSYSDPPAHHGGHRFIFWPGPCSFQAGCRLWLWHAVGRSVASSIYWVIQYPVSSGMWHGDGKWHHGHRPPTRGGQAFFPWSSVRPASSFVASFE
jgi:hypothetical protein